MKDKNFRFEKDSMGIIKVPSSAYWGAQTQRAIFNFPISGIRIPIEIVRALAVIKKCAAIVNYELGLLPQDIKRAIVKACDEIVKGKFDDHFPLDIFQTGSGTSTNMNMNEVIANRANELLGHSLGSKYPVHPNDHVNMGQSSNDVFPSAMQIALRIELEGLIESLALLKNRLYEKEKEFKNVIKIGRTHLQDAVPMTLGQEFSGYKDQIKNCLEFIKLSIPFIEKLPLGGTAIGTGVNSHPNFGKMVVEKISKETGFKFKEARNKFSYIATRDAVLKVMSALSVLSSALIKIANDIRLLSSGPRTGLGEIILPSLQPGSSIMPGKVNPVIPEVILQVSAYVIGAFVSSSIGDQNAPLELNIMQPLIGYNSLFSVKILKNSVYVFSEKCIKSIRANKKRCEEIVEWSISIVTPLAKKIGYDKAAEIAKRALKENKRIIDIVIEEKLLPEEEAKKILNPKNML